MQLDVLDLAIIAAYLAVAVGIGLWFRTRAGGGLADYFVSGRSLPWWIAGTSMVATTFAADTPLAVTGLVAHRGLAGNWFWWAFALGGMLTVFVFAKLWRRAEVLTDVELIELRYTGKPAAFLRGFRAVYVAGVVNSFIIGWVTQAMLIVLRETVLFGTPADSGTDMLLVLGLLAVTGIYSVTSGMWGVAIADVVQFVLAMIGCIVFAAVAVDHVGGIGELQQRVQTNFGGNELFAFVPDFDSAAWMPAGVFLALALGQWWATWYPGQEPGGGGYIVQRMAACRDERHAVKATLLFQLAHYCLRPWPWILVAFAALAMHPELRSWALDDDPATNPNSGYPMLIRELAPAGLRGLLLVTFFAAYMSTISTQMNWGASYLVNDLYRRFVSPQASERKLVLVSRLASVLVMALGGLTAWIMSVNNVSVESAWAVLAALGGGLGLPLMLRWFWWRINAWSEIAAMAASLVMFAFVQLWQGSLAKGDRMAGEYTSLLVATGSLGAWLAATFATAPEPREHLAAFYRRIRPDGPGWRPISRLAPDVRPDGALGRSLLCAALGTAVIWLTLPGIGALIFGEAANAALCLGGAVAAAAAMLSLSPRADASPASPR
jgi:Na+/proline symporter